VGSSFFGVWHAPGLFYLVVSHQNSKKRNAQTLLTKGLKEIVVNGGDCIVAIPLTFGVRILGPSTTKLRLHADKTAWEHSIGEDLSSLTFK
jgi:hypothetical protein